MQIFELGPIKYKSVVLIDIILFIILCFVTCMSVLHFPAIFFHSKVSKGIQKILTSVVLHLCFCMCPVQTNFTEMHH
jgi:hypothetical protein